MPTTTKELARIWAANPSTPSRDPGESKYALGFVAEIPTYQVLNYLHNRIDVNILALAERGVFQWGNDVTYVRGAKAWDEVTGGIYQAKAANPSKTLSPSQNPTEWEKSLINLSMSEYTKMRQDLDNHIGSFSNPHNLTTEQLDTYTRTVIDTMAANIQSGIDAHIADKANPHQDTAASIGAVPISGGVYGGAINHATGEVVLGNSGATTSVKTLNGDIFLRNGTLEFGVDAAGQAYVKNANGKSLILDEALFLTVKMAEEKNYATPLPATECKFHTDLNVYAGVGPVQFTSPGGRTFTNRAGVIVTTAVDQPRITPLGMAFNDATEVLEMIRTYDGVGWAEGTMELDFYIASTTNTGLMFLIEDDGFMKAKVGLSGSSLDFRWTNLAGVESIEPLTTALTAGRHRFVMSADATGRIKLYLDGVLLNNILTSPPARTGWTKSRFMKLQSGTNIADNYMVGFRVWSVVLTDKQVTGL